jgi:hypothetical protein
MIAYVLFQLLPAIMIRPDFFAIHTDRYDSFEFFHETERLFPLSFRLFALGYVSSDAEQ